MTDKKNNDIIEEFSNSTETINDESADITSNLSSYLLDEDRISIYITLSALLDAQIPMKTALSIIKDEYYSLNKKHFADIVVEFFTTVVNYRKNENEKVDNIGEKALKLFSKPLLKPEELILLRGLAHTDNVSSLLKSAIEVINLANLNENASNIRRR